MRHTGELLLQVLVVLVAVAILRDKGPCFGVAHVLQLMPVLLQADAPDVAQDAH